MTRPHNGTVSVVGYDVAEPEEATLARWWPKITCVETCMEWNAAVRKDGYGVFSMVRKDGKRRMRAAHRVSYEMFVGPIPEYMDIDHLCRNRKCVRPQHLEAVSRLENLRRGQTVVARQLAVTGCPKGHSYDEVNTYWYGNKRECRECKRLRNKARWENDPEYRAQSNAGRRRRWAEGR